MDNFTYNANISSDIRCFFISNFCFYRPVDDTAYCLMSGILSNAIAVVHQPWKLSRRSIKGKAKQAVSRA